MEAEAAAAGVPRAVREDSVQCVVGSVQERANECPSESEAKLTARE